MPEAASAFLRVESVVHGRIEGYEQYSEIPLKKMGKLVIGRQTAKEDSDIRVVGDDFISQNHAEIRFDGEKNRFIIRDMGSTNGTFLNEEQLEAVDLGNPENKRYYDLTHNCHIGLAKINGKFRVELIFRENSSTNPPWVKSDYDAGPGGDIFNWTKRIVKINGAEVSLTKTEFKVLEILKDYDDAVDIDIIAEELARRTNKEVFKECVSQHICRIRKKLGETPENSRHIITEPGHVGRYRFVT